MDLNKIKDDFIRSTKEGSKVVYSRKIQVFTEYLGDKCGVNEFNSKETLRGIGTDKIIESIEYYVDNYGISFKSTVDTYVTVIKSYFLFNAKQYDIHNDNFDSNAKILILDDLIDKRIDELDLNKTKMKEPISDSEFKSLLDSCNNYINSFKLDEYSSSNKYNGDASMFISAVIVKLVMYTGIKNSVISKIKRKDYNYDLNQIKINGLWIDSPDGLAITLKTYIKLRDTIITQKKIHDDENKQFFINSGGHYMSKPKSDEI